MPDLPPSVSIDQEGGRVARLKAPFSEWPPMATLARGDLQLAERFARALAAELKAVGVTLDYAPVLDVMTNAKNPVIGDPCACDEADDVARLARRSSGHSRPRMAACGSISRPWRHERRLPVWSCRWWAFRRSAARDSVRAVPRGGTGRRGDDHDGARPGPPLDEDRPATLSRASSPIFPARRLGYGGVILSGDLEMKASRRRTPSGRAVMAIDTGSTASRLQRRSPTQAATLEALVHAVEASGSDARVEDALQRQQPRRSGSGPAMTSRPARWK